MNGYDLSRYFFDWSFENPEKVTPNHVAVYFFAIEHCNRLGWKEKFGFPTEMAKESIGIKSYKTYMIALNDLVEWGFIKMIQKSKNQYSANIVALVKNTKALPKALSKATLKHISKQVESTTESISTINKPLTTEPINHEQGRFSPPDFIEAVNYLVEEKKIGFTPAEKFATEFINFYESNGWKVGKNKMKNWKAALSGWISRAENFKPKNNGTDKPTFDEAARKFLGE